MGDVTGAGRGRGTQAASVPEAVASPGPITPCEPGQPR